MSVELLACESCGGAERDEQGLTRGQRLIAQLRSQHSELRIERTRCLWNCQRSCSVHVRGPGRVGYVLGDLDPSPETAQALLDWAALYAASPDGAVPFKTWPARMRGHFVCRIPCPEPATPEETS